MSDSKKIVLVYDKECSVCHYYCLRVRIDESVGKLELVNAREPAILLDEITSLGWDIDRGMVLKLDNTLYYGPDAINVLSVLGTRSGLFNRCNFWLFRSSRVAKLLYPVLKVFRNLLLKLHGRSKINNLNIRGNDRF